MVTPKKTAQPWSDAPRPFAGGRYFDRVRKRWMVLTDHGPVAESVPPAIKVTC